jgi:hypothetical protein
MKQLIATVNTNKFLTAVQAEEDFFKDFFLYNTIKIYHIFSSHRNNKGVLSYYNSDLIWLEEMADLKVAETLMA